MGRLFVAFVAATIRPEPLHPQVCLHRLENVLVRSPSIAASGHILVSHPVYS